MFLRYARVTLCLCLMGGYTPAQSKAHGTFFLEKGILQDASFLGQVTLKEVTADSLRITGPLKFHDLTVKGKTRVIGPVSGSNKGLFGALSIIGPLKAHHVQCEHLKVIGPVDIADWKVLRGTKIVGPLTAVRSTFQELHIAADLISLEDVSTQDILVEKNKKSSQVLQLKGKTVVQGDIVFESGKGLIDKGPHVKIQGTIQGAIIRKSSFRQ